MPNSINEVVVEGNGDHCCIYMASGCVSLGNEGHSVVMDMTNGLSYLFNMDDTLVSNIFKPS